MPATGDLSQVLARLARGTVIADGNLQEVLAAITETAAQALHVERVNIWIMEDGRSLLRCIEGFATQTGQHFAGEVLRAAEYPSYFAALEQLRTIAALDAQHDPHTQELAVTYLARHGITTMLDAPIYLSGKVEGVVCHEHSGSLRTWTGEEKSFAASIADFVSLALEADRRVRAERGLRESEAFLRTLAAQIPDQLLLLEVDVAGHQVLIRSANLAACQAYGYAEEELRGHAFSLLMDPISAAKFPDRIRQMIQGELLVYEALHRRKDGTPIPVEVAGRALQFGPWSTVALLVRDITRRKQAERAALEQQASLLEIRRLESLGLLASSVAHDFNNLLTNLMGQAGLARMELPPDSPVQARLEQIDLVAERAGDLCRQLLAYATRRPSAPEPLNLSALTAETARLLEHSLTPRAALVLDLREILPHVLGDATQVRQIIMNLLTNAAEAIATPPGKITVRTGVEEIAAPVPSCALGQLRPGPYVFLEIADNGVGMDEPTKAQVFAPFYSTKKTGHGLGLAMMRRLVLEHHAAIRLHSQPGHGTTFRAMFPVASTEEGK